MNAKVLLQYKNPFIGIVIIVAFAILVQGILSHYFLQRDEIAAKMRELEEGQLTILKWTRLSSDAKKLEESFLTKDTLFFKKFVEERANSFGIRITSLKTSNIETDFYWETTMHLGMTCSYKDFIKLLGAIEQKSIVAEKIKITGGQNIKDEKITLTLKGFILK